MRPLSTFFVVSVTALSLAGCGQMPNWQSSAKSTAHGGMAVVDLDKVALETGRDRQLAQSIKMEENSLNQFLAKNVESAKAQLEAKKKDYGDEMSDTEKKELSDWTVGAQNKLSQLSNQARAKYQQFVEAQKTEFRRDVKPIAQEIAAKRGLGIVVPKNEGLLLSVDPGVDITDEVVKVMREKHPTPPVTPAAPPATPAPSTETAESDLPPQKPAPTTKSAKSAARRSAARSDDDQGSTR